MLQQTRVETVIPYYERWMRAFPTVESLARAPLGRVLKFWEGLGYYQRARNLHRAARQWVRNSRETVRRPFHDFLKWRMRELPGVGRYTAGAIASIAFDERVPAVDGNVMRVLCRVFNVRDPLRRPATQRRLWALAEALLPQRRCGEFNQALMELGALVCLPANPRCGDCPLRKVCAAPTDALPHRGARGKLQQVIEDVMLVRRNGRVLLRRRPSEGLLGGLWELPPRPGKRGRLVLTVQHTITDRRITLRVWECRVRRVPPGCRWMSPSRLAMPAAHRRVLRLAQ